MTKCQMETSGIFFVLYCMNKNVLKITDNIKFL